MKAKITNVKRQDQTFDVEVKFTEGTFDEKRVLNFNQGDDWSTVSAEITRVGQGFSQVLTTVADLETKVGTVITI